MAELTRSAGISAMLWLGTPSIFGQTATDPQGGPPRTIASQSGDERSPGDEPARKTQPVRLMLRIAGLGAEGCEVEIKPATPACRFTPMKRQVSSSGELNDVIIKDLEVRGANRNCSFAITVTEPGQKSRTILRGFRLAAAPSDPGTPAPLQTFACWLSSPSKIARIEGSPTRK